MPPKVGGPVPVTQPRNAEAAIPAKAIDVSTLTPAELKALPPAYQAAVKQAKAYAEKSFAGMAPAPQVLVVASASNGNAPVTVIVPPGAKEPLSVQTHYHGDRATSVGGENAAADELGKRVKAGDTTVYVLPEAKAAGGRTDWTNAGDIDKTTTEALAAAGLGDKAVGHTTISVHSAGGRALANAIKDGKQLKADELVLQDALFEGANGPGAYSALKQTLPGATAGVKQVTIVPSQETDTAAARSAAQADALKKAQRPVTVLPPTKTHAQTAGILDTSGPLPAGKIVDHFVPA
jgi:hypothetical protein